jgi:hypothetical protein
MSTKHNTTPLEKGVKVKKAKEAKEKTKVYNGRVVKSVMQKSELYCCGMFESDCLAWVYVLHASDNKVRVRIMYNDSGDLLYDDEFGLYSLTNKLPFSFKGHMGTVFCCDDSCLKFREVSPHVARSMLLKSRFEDALALVEDAVVSFTFACKK